MTTALLSEPVTDTITGVVATAPFTADDVAYCQERLARWRAHIEQDPAAWPTRGNEDIWLWMFTRLAAHARGEAGGFEGLVSSVAIDGSPAQDPRCRALLLHMLQAVVPADEQAVIA